MSSPVDRSIARNKRREAKRVRRAPSAPILPLLSEQYQPVPRPKADYRPIKPLTQNQALYDKLIHTNTMTFGIGPAGTGKTWLAARRAAEKLRDREIERLIVSRPALEAGERLGFLPGDLREKTDPFFRPVAEALIECLGIGHFEYLIENEKIEMRPLGLIRGATLKNAWVILDEAQNTTAVQMKLFLTRLGENSKMIINGDPRQCDLPPGCKSGLIDAMSKLHDLDDVAFVHFTVDDIVRHGLVREIVRRYESRSDETPSVERYNNPSDDDHSGLMRTLGVANE